MKFTDVIRDLQNLKNTKITQADIANALKKTRANISLRIKNKSEVTISELEIIENYFNVKLFNEIKDVNCNLTNNDFFKQGDCEHCQNNHRCKKLSQPIELFYVDGISDAWKRPDLTSFNFDVQMIKTWNREINNIKVVVMAGDRMAGGSYPFNNRDILLIDISETDLSKSGAYFFSSRNNKNFFLCNLDLKMNGDVEFTFKNTDYKEYEKIKTAAELKELDFRVIGRVFKNMTYNA